MNYYSLNDLSAKVDFKEATLRGQAPDKGLYFPERIPRLPEAWIEQIESFSREEIAFRVIQPYVGDSLPEKELQRILSEAIPFDFPLVPVTDRISALELFHGPTLAFKDVGARFMSRCLGYFVKDYTRPVTVLVATSGDTGGAVASGFYEVEGVRVVILYPSGKVSSVQELQLTTLGKNISALEVNGSFDDCQRIAKEAFADAGLNRDIFLTSANSINVARWLPQQFYYFFAWRQWADKDHPPVISVPSGNFGNICAGLMAYRSGLPVSHFIAACNANDTVPSYLQTGEYVSRPAIATLSNAMDVGDPSNFVRILEIFSQKFPSPENHRFPSSENREPPSLKNREPSSLKDILTATSISDEETRAAIRELIHRYRYLPDPHGAVGYLALVQYLETHPGKSGFFMETAHPVKFYDTVERITGEKIPLPASIGALLKRPKQSVKIEARYDELKSFLLS
jgi:threonine synthase